MKPTKRNDKAPSGVKTQKTLGLASHSKVHNAPSGSIPLHKCHRLGFGQGSISQGLSQGSGGTWGRGLLAAYVFCQRAWSSVVGFLGWLLGSGPLESQQWDFKGSQRA
jgi:hypothetical protein